MKRKTLLKTPSVLLWGARTKARIIHQMLLDTGFGVPKIVFDSTVDAPFFDTKAKFYKDIRKLKTDLHKVTHFVTCIGGEDGYARCRVSQILKKVGLKAMTLIHDKSFIDSLVEIGEGTQLMPFAIVQKFTKVGQQCVLNTNSTIDHDCIIGDGVHIMGNAALAGMVEVGDYATIGTNATVLPRIKIGEGAFVGAGAVVTKDVAPFTVVMGNPARFAKKIKLKFNKEILILLE